MDKAVKDRLAFRKQIVNSLDELVRYSKSYNDNKDSTQLSLFSSNEIEIQKPTLKEVQLNEFEATKLLDQEVEMIGLNLTYDLFSEFFLLEQTLCTHKLQDLDNAIEPINNGIMLVRIDSLEHRTSKNGKYYGKIHISRDGLKLHTYQFGDDYENVFNSLHIGDIYLMKFNYDPDYNMIKATKMQKALDVDPNKYIEKIGIEIIDLDRMKDIRNYVFCCKNPDGVPAVYKVAGEKYPIQFNISLTDENAYKLHEKGAKLKIFRRR